MTNKFHAHIYYSLEEKPYASELQAALIARFPNVAISHLVDYAVGPHLFPMFQVAFFDTDFLSVRDYLLAHRGDLSVLIHPIIQDDLLAHTDEALWLGPKLAVNIAFLKALAD